MRPHPYGRATVPIKKERFQPQERKRSESGGGHCVASQVREQGAGPSGSLHSPCGPRPAARGRSGKSSSSPRCAPTRGPLGSWPTSAACASPSPAPATPSSSSATDQRWGTPGALRPEALSELSIVFPPDFYKSSDVFAIIKSPAVEPTPGDPGRPPLPPRLSRA